MVINLIVTCTDKKSLGPVVQARQLPGSAVEDRVSCWVDMLRTNTLTTSAEGLYQGDHWSVARSMLDKVNLWVASAGYGLVHARAELVPYSATFATGQPDTVTTGAPGERISNERRAWWDGLQTLLNPRGPRLADLVSTGPTLIAASKAYLDAMVPEILEAGRCEHGLLIVSASEAPVEVRQLRLPASGRARMVLGGSMQSVNVRLARHIISSLESQDLTIEVAAEEVRRLEASAPPLDKFERSKVSDSDVKQFINHQLKLNPRASRTGLLRAFRSTGRACEQGRFHRLFQDCSEGK